jgi:hypothetical protein
MDVNPDVIATVAIEAWLMARTETLRTGPPTLTSEEATQRAIAELKHRYPDIGGALRRFTIANTFGTVDVLDNHVTFTPMTHRTANGFRAAATERAESSP